MTTALYVRVSSSTQDHRSQEADLSRWVVAQGIAVVWYRDKATGTSMERPGMDKLLGDIRSGKVNRLVVWRLDRLGRTAKGLLELFEELTARKVGFLSLKDAIDLSTPTGRLTVGILASVAQFETEVRSERQRAGIAAVREQNGGKCTWGGRKAGTRVKVTVAKEGVIRDMRAKEIPVSVIAKTLSLSRPTVYAVLARPQIAQDAR